MKDQILKKLQELNQKTKEILFFNFIVSEVYDSIRINTETFQAKHVEIVKALIESGIDVNFKSHNGNTALFFAKSKEVAEVLIQAGADVNFRNHAQSPPLFFARSKELAEVLIRNGADINAQNESNNSSLHYHSDQKIIEFLIQLGADAYIKNDDNQTPAEWHRKKGNSDLADFIEQKAFEKATKLERKKLNQALPQSPKSSNNPQYRL